MQNLTWREACFLTGNLSGHSECHHGQIWHNVMLIIPANIIINESGSILLSSWFTTDLNISSSTSLGLVFLPDNNVCRRLTHWVAVETGVTGVSCWHWGLRYRRPVRGVDGAKLLVYKQRQILLSINRLSHNLCENRLSHNLCEIKWSTLSNLYHAGFPWMSDVRHHTYWLQYLSNLKDFKRLCNVSTTRFSAYMGLCTSCISESGSICSIFWAAMSQAPMSRI